MNTHLGRCLVASVSCLALATVAEAQTRPVASQAPAAVPAAPAIPAAAVTVLDTISVTATKTGESAVDTLGGTSVVTGEDIARIQASRISDALRNVPGVTVQESPNTPEQAINIRGLQDFGRVNVLVDGARQNFQATGHSASGTFYLDPEMIGGVDITRGPVATIYGSGAIGGVAAFRTRTIDDILNPGQTFGVEQKTGFGTNGAGFINRTSVGVRAGPNVDLFGQFVYRNTNTYEDGIGNKVRDSSTDLTGGLFKANFRPADGHEISVSALAQAYNFSNYGTSNTTTSTRFKHDVEAQTYTLGYHFARPEIPLIDLTMKAYYSATKDDQTVITPSSTYRSLGVAAGAPLTYDIGTTGFDIYNTSRFATGPLDHALTYGLDGVHDDVTTTDRAGGYGSAFTPSGKRDLIGGFLQDEVRYGGWLRVLGALRYDSYELEGGNTKADGDRLSPKITVGVTPFKGFEIYGTYAEAYRAPALSETLIDGIHPFPPFRIRPNPNLKPETAHNLEAGVNLKYDSLLKPGDALRAKLSVFTNQVDDYIEQVSLPGTVPYVPCGIPRFCTVFLPDVQYQNISKARLQGIEGEAVYDWGWGFAQVAGAIIDGKNKQTGDTLLTAPPDKIGGTLAFRFYDERVTVGTRVTAYNDKSVPIGYTLTPSSKSYGLVDLFASYKYSETVRGDVVLENILDKRYRPYLNGDYSPGFAARFALTVKFAS